MGKKITILGAGNVGASIAFALTVDGMVSEILLVDINKDKAMGEALDIVQGTPFCSPVNVYAGDYSDAVGSDIVVYAAGIARKPGQTRLDLASRNLEILDSIMPQITKYAPDAVYVVVSNPVDILTYAMIKRHGLPAHQAIGTGTILDTARLRAGLAEHVHLNSKNIHAYVFGEHGDSFMIPWSLTSICGLPMDLFCTDLCEKHNTCGKVDLRRIEKDIRESGATVIRLKGSTHYAIALSTRQVCEAVFQDLDSMLTVSGFINGRYGINDVCLSLPFVLGSKGIKREITPPLLPEEEEKLRASANVLKEMIQNLKL